MKINLLDTEDGTLIFKMLTYYVKNALPDNSTMVHLRRLLDKVATMTNPLALTVPPSQN